MKNRNMKKMVKSGVGVMSVLLFAIGGGACSSGTQVSSSPALLTTSGDKVPSCVKDLLEATKAECPESDVAETRVCEAESKEVEDADESSRETSEVTTTQEASSAASDVPSTTPASATCKSADDDTDELEDDSKEGGKSAEVDLPYDVRPQVGETLQLSKVFLLKGAAPAKIVSVVMDGQARWRLSELQADTAFVVTENDCTHQGNRDVGRDRVYVKWENADGTTHVDHLDIRYCK